MHNIVGERRSPGPLAEPHRHVRIGHGFSWADVHRVPSRSYLRFRPGKASLRGCGNRGSGGFTPPSEYEDCKDWSYDDVKSPLPREPRVFPQPVKPGRGDPRPGPQLPKIVVDIRLVFDNNERLIGAIGAIGNIL
jgi:hypothetical protein